MDMELIKKEIHFRARRGIKEMDIVFANFIEKEMDSLSPADLNDLQSLLLETDLDLFGWLNSGTVPAQHNTPVFHKIKDNFKKNTA